MKPDKSKQKRHFLIRAMIVLELCILVPVLLLILSNQIIQHSTSKYLFDSVYDIPYNHTALVLGTSPFVRSGGKNPYFSNRMEAAASLYHNNKVSYLLVSGDNRTKYYNEPEQMQRALTELGVPSTAIIMDNAGLRTYDSVIRAKDVFGRDSITIVSQKFHNQRAVFIARQKGIAAQAYNAHDVSYSRRDRTQFREWFAKAMVFWDLLINKKPKHTGESIVD